MKKYYLFSLISFALYSCTHSNQEEFTLDSKDLTSTIHRINEQSEECNLPNQRGCAQLEASYPTIALGGEKPNQSLLKSLNDSIYALFVQPFIDFIPEEIIKKNATIPQLKAAFFKKHTIDQKKNKERIGYQLINDVTAPFISDVFASIQQKQMTYAGGAHPDTEILYFTLDLKTGKTLHPYSWMKDTNAVKEQLLKVLKKQVNMDETMDLEDYGFFISDREFLLTSNILIEEDSVSFAYNSYELAPYSFGIFDLKLPKSAVQFNH